MHAGIDVKFIPMSATNREKGVDVALAIDALQVGLEGKIDIAVLVTGDAEDKSFINERLLSVCNYSLNINSLEHDKDFKAAFKGLFRKPDDFTDEKTTT